MATTSVPLVSTASFGNPLWRNAGTNPLTNAALPAAIASATPVYKVSTTQSAEILLPFQSIALTAFITSLQVIVTTAIQSGTANQPILVSIGVLTNGTYQYTQSQALTLSAVNTLSFPTKPDGTAWTTADIPNSVLKIIDQSTSGVTNLASLTINAISTTVPTVTIAPITTIPNSTPQVTWTYSDGDLALQSGYQVQVINPTTGAAVYDSGFIVGPDTVYTIPANPLVTNGTNVNTAFNPAAGTSGIAWAGIATSTDGTKVYAAGASGIYVSTNSGLSFSLAAGTASISWNAIACSLDGTRVYAVGGSSVQFYVSTNSGLSFTNATSVGFTSANAIACSSDGSKVFIAGINFGNNGIFLLSTNFGLSFSSAGGTAPFNTVTCSSDGTKVYLGSSDGLFYVSTNSGTTFATTTVSPNGLTAVRGIATSSDGTKVYTVVQEAVTSTTAGPNGAVNAMAAQADGKIVIGGAFTSYNGTSAARLTRVSVVGVIDAAFNTNIGTGPNGIITAISIQSSDQKIVVGGYFTSFNGTSVNRLIRLNTDGTIDTTFVTNIGTGANAVVNAIAVQADGKIVIGGAFTNFASTLTNYIARLNSTGTVDTAFTANGVPWVAQTLPTLSTGQYQAIAWNGTVFCAINQAGNFATSSDGITWTPRTVALTQTWFGIAWNGTVFCVIGNGNVALTSPDGITWTSRTMANSLQWQAIAWNGTVFCAVAFGSSTANTSPTGTTWTAQTLPSSQIWTSIAWNGTVFCAVTSGSSAVAATSPDGATWTPRTLPSSQYWSAIAWNGTVFCAISNSSNAATSPDGATWTPRTLPSGAFSIIAANGNLFCAVAAGSTNSVISTDGITWTTKLLPSSLTWISITTNGTIFCTIATNSAATLPATVATLVLDATDVVTSIAVQPSDQKIVVGGYFTSFNGKSVSCVVRLNTDGSSDPVFAPNIGAGVIYAVNSIAIQTSDAKIVIGGLFYTPFNANTANAIRLNTDGTTDTSFLANLGASVNAQINVVAIQPTDGKILLSGGFTTFNGTSTYPVVRLNTDGTRDTSFSTNVGTTSNDEIRSLIAQSTGRILLGGVFTTFNTLATSNIVSLNSDGTRDVAFIGRVAVWVSTNSASTFTVVSSTYGIPFNSISCSTDGLGIYATAYDSSDTSLNGVYFSTNSGSTFTILVGTSGIFWNSITCTYNAGTVYGTSNIGYVYALYNIPQYKFQVRVSKNINGLNNFTAYSSFTPSSTAFNDTIPTGIISLQSNKPTVVITLPDVTGLGYTSRSVVILRKWSGGYGVVRNGLISNVGLTASTISFTDYEAPTGVTVYYQIKTIYFDASGNQYVGSLLSLSIATSFNSKWIIQKCDGYDPGISVNTLIAGVLALSRTRPQAHQYPLGSRYPITTSGTVQGYNGDLTIYFDNQPAFIAFMPYVDYIGKLLITAPNGAYKYITLDKNDVTKSFGRGSDILRELKLTYTEEDSGLGFNEPTLYEF